MKITELLIESQPLDEGPFTQAIGKVGGKIAKGVANIGKDLKTGFKAGYGGEQPPADTAATTVPAAAAPVKKAAPTQAAPVKKPGLLQKIGKAAGEFNQGYQQGQSGTTAPATTDINAQNDEKSAAAPAADPAAEKAAKIGVGQINKIIPTLRTRDLMSLKKNLDAVIAKKSAEKPAAAAPAADTTTAAPASQTAPAAATPPEAVAKQGRKKKAAPTTGGAGAFNQMAQQVTQQNASIERVGNNLSETLARKVQEQRQRMVAEGLVNGSIRIFKQ
jgi:hypothetical protein